MAATATYIDSAIGSTSKNSSPANTRSNAKRKRDTSPAPARPAPANRQQAGGDVTLDADTNTSGFDLSTLQTDPASSNSVQQSQGTNIDTAAAALSYSMPAPDTSGSGFHLTTDLPSLPQNGTTTDTGGASPGADGATSQSPGLDPSTPSGIKHAVGSPEWHQVRKDNHKEVERRRRETINEGINELAKIVPGCEKNKGSILQRAVQYIQKLQDDAQANIDKWTFEKLVTEQAINDLSAKLERCQRERGVWRGAAEEAGADMEAVARRAEAEEEGEKED